METDGETKKRLRFLITLAYYASIAAAAWFCIKYLLGIALPFLLGLGIALALRPAAESMAKKLRFKRRAAAIALTVLVYVAAAGAMGLLAAAAVNSARRLTLRLPEVFSEVIAPALALLEGLVARFAPRELAGPLDEWLRAAGRRIGAALLERSAAALSELPSAAAALGFTIIFSLFICADYGRVTGFLARLIPERHRLRLHESKAALTKGLSRLLGAYLTLAALTFGILLTAFLLLGVAAPFGAAAAIAALDALPVTGSGLALIPWGLLELLRGNTALGAGLLITFGIATVARELLEPRLIGKRIGISPVASLAAMYFGLRLFGTAGLLLAPPLLLLIAARNKK